MVKSLYTGTLAGAACGLFAPGELMKIINEGQDVETEETEKIIVKCLKDLFKDL